MPVTAPTPLPSHAARVMGQAAVHPGVAGGMPQLNAGLQQANTGMQAMAQSALASGLIPHSLESRRRQKAEAHAEVVGDKPGIVTRIMDGISHAGSAFFAYDFGVLTILGGAIGMMAGGINKLSDWTNSKTVGSVGGWFERRSKGLKGQREALEKTEISESLETAGKSLHRATGRVFGEDSAIARGMGSVAKGAEEAQGGLNRGFRFVGEKVSNGLGSVVSSFGPEVEAMAVRHSQRAEGHLGKLREHVKKAEDLLTAHGEQLGNEVFDKTGMTLKGSSTFIPEGSKATQGAMRSAADHMKNVRGNFETMRGLLEGAPTAEQAQKARTLMAEMRGDLEAVRALHGGDATLKKAAGELGSALGKMHRPLTGAMGRLEKAQGWRSLPETIAKLPETFGKTDTHHALFSTAIMAGMGAEAAHTAFDAKHDFKVLSAMVEAVEGKKPSTMHVLMGDIPPCLIEARHHFFGKHKPEVIAEVIAGVANLAFLKKGASMMAMFPVVAAPMIGNAMADKNPTIQMYETLTKMQNGGQELTPAMYAEFVHSLVEKSDTLNMEKHRPEAREKLFMEYAEKKTSVDMVLKDIHNGVLEQRATELDKELALKEANAAPQQDKQVVGKHTAKVVHQRVGESVSPSQPVANENEPVAGSQVHKTEVGPRTEISHVASAERLAAAPHAAVGGAPA